MTAEERPQPPQGIRTSADTIDITPGLDVPLAGYIARRQAEAIHSRLEANVMVLSDGHALLVLVTVDLLYAGSLEAELRARLELPDHAVIITAASHTHFGPAYGEPRVGVDEDRNYEEQTSERIADCVRSCLRSLESASETPGFAYGQAAGRLAISRRKYHTGRNPQGEMGRVLVSAPNSKGDRDDTVSVLLVGDPAEPSAIVWSFACHPVGFPRRNDISSEFAGWVRHRLRSRYGEVPVLFLAGFGGDQRPTCTIPKGVSVARSLVSSRIGFGSAWIVPTLERWQSWSDRLATTVIDAAENAIETEADCLRVTKLSTPLSELGISARVPTLDLYAFRIGSEPSVSFFCFNAEMMAAFGATMTAEAARYGHAVVNVGYVGSVLGYLPTDRMVAEGGYEADQSRAMFGIQGEYQSIDKKVAGLAGAALRSFSTRA